MRGSCRWFSDLRWWRRSALVLLLRQERRARVPLLPIALLRQAAIWRCDALAACVGSTMLSLITFVPIYLEVVYGTTPSQTGFLMLPLTACVALGSMCTGQLIARTGRDCRVPFIRPDRRSVSCWCWSRYSPRIFRGRQLPWAFGLASIGLGSSGPVVNVTVQMVAGPKQLGSAAASIQFSRSIGSAFGTAVVGAVLFATLTATDQAYGVAVCRAGAARAGGAGRIVTGAGGGGTGGDRQRLSRRVRHHRLFFRCRAVPGLEHPGAEIRAESRPCDAVPGCV